VKSLLCSSGSLLSQGDSPPRPLGRGSIVSHPLHGCSRGKTIRGHGGLIRQGDQSWRQPYGRLRFLICVVKDGMYFKFIESEGNVTSQMLGF